jgi:Fe-S-cluster containining protein
VELRLDAEQRFSCHSCGRCCRRGEIVVSVDEAEVLRHSGAAAWFREAEGLPEGTTSDPFAPVAGQLVIRRRPDGACGFLSPANRCRIHEELGGAQKPLTCRLFPFQLHPGETSTLVTASFACPSVVRSEGTPLPERLAELQTLHKHWRRRHDEAPAPLQLVEGRSLSEASLDTLRISLRRMLDRPGPDGPPDLRANARRMAASLEDLSRYRVVRLADHAFAEYLELTIRHAAGSDKTPPPRPPALLSQLFQRGLLFAVIATGMQVGAPRSGLRVALRWRLFRVLLHLHGLWPRTAGVDRSRIAKARLELAEPAIHERLQRWLRSAVETLGSRQRFVVDELGVAVGLINAGCLLAAMREGAAGQPLVRPEALEDGLVEAADLSRVAPRSAFGSLITTLAGDVESLHLFAAGPKL